MMKRRNPEERTRADEIRLAELWNKNAEEARQAERLKARREDRAAQRAEKREQQMRKENDEKVRQAELLKAKMKETAQREEEPCCCTFIKLLFTSPQKKHKIHTKETKEKEKGTNQEWHTTSARTTAAADSRIMLHVHVAAITLSYH